MNRSECDECGLCNGNVHPFMDGVGPCPADLMIVGEAPGREEDQRGVPFVGKAGALLNLLLEKAGIDRSLCYITNAVRCRPPYNVEPSRRQITLCRALLKEEIAAVQPRCIVALGNAALQSLAHNTGISKHRGLEVRLFGTDVWLMPTFHPAAALRSPHYKPLILADLRRVAALLAGRLSTEGCNYQFFADLVPITTGTANWPAPGMVYLEGLIARPPEVMAFDLETKGLHPTELGAEIKLVGFSTETGSAVSFPYTPETWPHLKAILENPAIKKVGHGVKFDLAFLRHFGIHPQRVVADTMLMAHLLDEEHVDVRGHQRVGLKKLAAEYTTMPNWAEGIDFETTPLDQLAQYNCADCDATLRLYEQFREKILAQPRLARLLTKLLMPASSVIADIERRGIGFSEEARQAADVEIGTEIELLVRTMLTFVPPLTPRPVNFNPSIFLEWLLFEHYGLPVYARTEKTKRPSTDESVLAQLSHPFVDLLRKYRKLKKLYGTYVEPYREYAVRGRIHCDYLLGGTVTGRLASHNPALQTIPNDKRIRDFFVPRSGWVLVQADFSQIELRVAAFISRDEVLLDAFRRQFDVHTLTASRILGKPLHRVTAEDRRLAKPVNFGLVYGMGARKLRDYARREYGVELSEEQAKEFRARFFGLYRGLHPWHEGVRNAVRRLQYVVSPLGRVRHLPNVRAQDDEVQGEAMRQAVNSPVQGMASDMTLLAMVLLDRELDPAHALLVANNHDAILFEADPERLPETLSQIKETMEHLPLEEMFGCKLDVPIEVEIKTGPSWGSLIPWSPPSPAPLSDELKSSEPTWSRPTEASTASEASPTC